jgi:hypothetical protein
MAGLIGMLRQIEAAEQHARVLRAEYGPLAEDHCKQELAGLNKRDAYRSHLCDVLKALPWIPEEKTPQSH